MEYFIFSFRLGIAFLLCMSGSSSAGISNSNNTSSREPYSTDLETELRTILFENYSVLQRPTEQVDITISLTILTLNELDIKNQVLSMTAFFQLVWEDSRLAWSGQTKDYSSVPFLFSTELFVWRPPLIVDNAVEDFSVISDKNIPMRVKNSGHVTWNPAGIFKVACDSDTTYYPLDIQTCHLSISSWAYTSTEITLSLDPEPIDMSFYSENGEWEIISYTSSTTSSGKSRGDQTFSNVKFTIKLRRRPLFHILNTLFPVALMAVLSAMVFKLPAESGEKLGFSLTVLLAYAVYLTLISDNIPSTSVNVCYLSIYLALILSFGTVSVICTIFVLNVYFRPDDEIIPNWTRKVVTKFLMPMTCWKKKSLCSKAKNRCGLCSSTDDVTKVEDISLHNKPPLPSDDLAKTEMEDSEVEDADADEKLTWQDIAGVLDKLLFLVFFSLILLSSIIVFGILMAEFVSVAES